jgi:acetylornithine/N-succinyldiaminopimelate aminotransferase
VDNNLSTIEIENKYFAPFFNKIPVSFDRGEGIYVFDENNKKYIDFTSGWGVTCIGHGSPVIAEALQAQSKKIIQNPNSGASYSPARAKLLLLLKDIVPHGLSRFFFSNSGAEANDAVIKLARKVSGKLDVISTLMSFHGRTISTASATGQSSHRNRYNPLMPNYHFVPYNDLEAISKIIKNDIAAVIVEPIQGEGGVVVPSGDYLERLSGLCKTNDVILILDEIQTGFFRTGPVFASSPYKMKVDFLTMAKGIAGGFPFGAFAMSEEVSGKLAIGDHGGTYCGNPLGCAVSHAVIKYLLENNIEENVAAISSHTFTILQSWKKEYPDLIVDIRGKGLLIAVEFSDEKIVEELRNKCLMNGLILNITQKKVVRIFPALNITKEEMEEGLHIFKNVLDGCASA